MTELTRWYVLPRARLQHVVFTTDTEAVRSPCGSILPASSDPRATAVAMADGDGFAHLSSCGRCYRAAARRRKAARHG